MEFQRSVTYVECDHEVFEAVVSVTIPVFSKRGNWSRGKFMTGVEIKAGSKGESSARVPVASVMAWGRNLVLPTYPHLKVSEGYGLDRTELLL